MSSPIDIEVQDSIDPSVEKKLAAISKEARSGHKALKDLQAALSAVNASPLAELQRASASNTNALARELTAQARMVDATTRAALADAKAALEKQRLATESQRTAAAEANAARAMSQSELAALRLAQAHARASQAKSQADKDAEKLAATLARLKMSVDPLAATLDRQNAELLEAQMLFAKGALSASEFAQYESILKARIEATTASIAAHNAALARGTVVSKHMTQAGLNLSRQFADIGVTAAMGMSPLMILIQQGPQVADAFATAKSEGLSFTQVLRGMVPASGALLVAIGAVAAILATAAAGFGLFHRELSRGYPKDITDGLNLTEEQLKRVESRTVTFGDTVAATFTVLGQRIMDSWVGDALRWIGQTASDVMDWIVQSVTTASVLFTGIMRGSLRTILDNWRTFPAAFGDMVVQGINLAITAIEGLVNKASEGLNFLIRAYNANPMNAIKLPEIPRAELGRLENEYAGAGSALGSAFARNVAEEAIQARNEISQFASDVGAEALRRARARALDEAGDPNKRSSRESPEERRSRILKNINDELDDQILLMGLVGDQLAIETRTQSILNGLQRRGITLTNQEAESIRSKVVRIQELSHVQRQLENIYNDATEAQRDFDTGIRAANQLLASGMITAEQYTLAINRLTNEHRQATDLFANFTDEMRDEAALLGQFGVQLSASTRLQSLANELKSRGRILTDAETASLRVQLEQRERELMVNQELGKIYEQNQGAIDGMAARTAALSIAHAQGVIGAEQYRVALNSIAMEAANVAIRQTEMATTGQMALASLQSYMASYQGMLPGLTQTFGNFFTTVSDGFANSIARSIVYAENFGTALLDVARSALTEFIASLVKLGIQWVITQAIGNSVGSAVAAASMAQGAAVAAAWAPAAAAVSLASFGANAVPAAAAISSTYGLTQLLSAIPGFKEGGYIRGAGGPRDDKILTRLSDGEFVVNAAATREHRALLEAINSGGTLRMPARADGGVVSSSPAPAYRPSSSTTNVSQGGLAITVDMRNSNFGNANPDELEERFMRAVATQLVPPVLEQARKQANEDMTVRFVRPRI